MSNLLPDCPGWVLRRFVLLRMNMPIADVMNRLTMYTKTSNL